MANVDKNKYILTDVHQAASLCTVLTDWLLHTIQSIFNTLYQKSAILRRINLPDLIDSPPSSDA